MPVIKLKYTNQEGSSLQVTTDTGSYTCPWPCHTWHAEEIQEAIKLGVSIEEWKTEEELIDELKSSLTSEVKSIRDTRMSTGGYSVNVDGVVKWFQSDAASRIQQLVLSQSDIIPADLMWKTMDGSFVVMTKTLAQNIVTSATTSDITIFAFAETLLATANATTELEALKEINVNSDWPLIYGE